MAENREPDTGKPAPLKKRRKSIFAARMAKKKSNLDQKISKLRKKASAGKLNKDTMPSSTESTDAHSTEKSASIDVDSSQRNPEKPHPVTQVEKKTPTKGALSAQSNLNKQKEELLPVDESEGKAADTTSNIIKASSVSKLKADTAETENIDSKSSPNRLPEKEPRNIPCASATRLSGSSRAGAFSGLGAGSKTIGAEPLIKGFLEKLESYPDLAFLNGYKLRARCLLSRHSSSNPVILVLMDKPACDELLTVDRKAQSSAWLFEHFPSTKVVRPADASSFDGCEALVRTSWASIARLSPIQIGVLREHIDLIVIESAPKHISQIELTPLLQRLSGNGQPLLLSDASFIDTQTTIATKHYSGKSGFSVLDKSRITELDTGDNSDLLDTFSTQIEDSDVEVRDFLSTRKVHALASQLEHKCDLELSKLSLVSAVSTLDAGRHDPTQLDKGLDTKIGKILANGRKQVSSQEPSIDALGQATLSKQEDSLDTASALVSGFSIKDIVMLDELDIQKFSSDDRKYINRVHRFRFASKLGNVWKLRQEYIESLHEKLLSRIAINAEYSFAQVDHYYQKELKELDNAYKDEEKARVKSLSQELLTAWPTTQQLGQSIKAKNNISHFRSALFSKRGSNAPIETQQGVMKELRESRMFVSQLMAFGMLFALLFGSSFAVDVLVSWFSGGSDSIGIELTQAAKDSRGLGRQIRILIQAVAGVAIIVYISLRFYLKPAEKIINRGKLVATYSTQLEDVCTSFLDEAEKTSNELIQSHILNLQQKYDELKANAAASISSHLTDAGGEPGIGKSDKARAILDLKKWINTQIIKKETISINKTLDSTTTALLGKITQ